MMKESDTIGGIAAQDARAARVLDGYGIDFCCGGGKTLQEACAAANISAETVINDLKALEQKKDESVPDFVSMKLDELTRYIEDVHHKYTEASVIFIGKNMERLVAVHGDRHPELMAVKQVLDTMAGHLAVHMKKEELMLFPFIRKMVKAGREAIGKAVFGSVASPVTAMMNDHDHEGERLKELDRLTGHYAVPPDGCNTYRATYAAMKELETDLHMHIHLENNILFPRAIELENSFRGN